jgi:hypothetical protein
MQAPNNGNAAIEDQHANEAHPESGVHARPSSSKLANVEAIATHVAAHLQSLMLLTLRLISINDLTGTSFDNQSLSSNPDDRSSNLVSECCDPDLDVERRYPSARSESAMSEHDFEHLPGSEIEDSEDIDWAYF